MSAKAASGPKADVLLPTQVLSFSCNVRLPESGQMFIGLRTDEIGAKPSLLNGMPNDRYCRKGTGACWALKLAAIGSFPETRQPGNDLLPKKFARAISVKG